MKNVLVQDKNGIYCLYEILDSYDEDESINAILSLRIFFIENNDGIKYFESYSI